MLRNTTPLFTVLATLGLLALTGPGCSDSGGGGAGNAGLCAQLDAKQSELDCKVAALGANCAPTDTACTTAKDSALAVCNNLTTANWTSVRTSLCGASTASATSSASTTATSSLTKILPQTTVIH